MPETLNVHLIAPSGWPSAPALARGVHCLQDMGCRVTGIEAAQRRYLRFAGDDDERAADINHLADPNFPLPDIIMAVRGGYGVHRLLDRIDYDGLQRRLADQPCVLVGHSDITTLSLALLAKTGLITFAGPMLAYDFGAEAISEFMLDELQTTLGSTSHAVHWQAPGTGAVDVEGVLWGGNLAVLCSLLGTAYLPSIDGGILFVEDVSEPLFRIERLLMQLKLSGVLDRQSALLLGNFSDYREDAYDHAYDLLAVIEYVRTITDVPVIAGLPFGHLRDKLTLPVGASAGLEVQGNGRVNLNFRGYPHLTKEWVRNA